MSTTAHLVSFIPSEDDVKLARVAKNILAPRPSSTSPFDLRAYIKIPAQAAHLLVQILDEMSRVLPRLPRISLNPDQIRDLADSFMFLADIVEPDEKLDPALRDAADQQVLATLRVSRADYLITGDKDLLVLADKYSIVTPVAFWQRHG